MNAGMPLRPGTKRWWVAGAIALVLAAIGWDVVHHLRKDAPPPPPPSNASSVEVTDLQLKQIKVEPVGSRPFTERREAVGYLDFDQDRTVPVYPTYPGRIRSLSVKAGDDVVAGALLYEIDSPDLAAAESTLVGAAASRELTRKALERAKGLYQLEGFAQKDYEQAVSDEQTAEGAFQAARDTVRAFGISDAELNRVVASRRVSALLPVKSPLAGRVTARAAAPGALVQPGVAPAPVTVADLSHVWLQAAVAESDVPLIRLGQAVEVRVAAFPERVFHGQVTNIAASVDPATHRTLVRAELPDPRHELKPQMLANFTIQTRAPRQASAIPVSGVVREGDGTMTIWVTTDRHHFTRRTVRLGLEQDGVVELLDGVQAGELVATDGALFLSNALTEAAR